MAITKYCFRFWIYFAVVRMPPHKHKRNYKLTNFTGHCAGNSALNLVFVQLLWRIFFAMKSDVGR